VTRIRQWLEEDEETSDSWFGRYAYGEPAHLGYRPAEMEAATDEEFARALEDPSHVTLSVYTDEEEHIGEIHLGLDEALGDGQLSILMGRRQLWSRGYGLPGVRAALDLAFNDYGLYRVWVDIPEFNLAARTLFERVGFTHEGTLRQSRPRGGARFNSVVMGILAAEYSPESG
jgi:RimJ/RimL family protein N-acetyltransferase